MLRPLAHAATAHNVARLAPAVLRLVPTALHGCRLLNDAPKKRRLQDAILAAEQRLEERLFSLEKRFEKALGIDSDKAKGFDDPAAREYMAHEREGDEIVFHDVEEAVMKAELALEERIAKAEKRVEKLLHIDSDKATGFNDPAAKELMAHEREGDQMVYEELMEAEKKLLEKVGNAEKKIEMRVWSIEKRLEKILGVDRAVGFNDPAAREYMAHEREGDQMVYDDVKQSIIDAEKKIEKKIVEGEKKAMFTEVHEHMSVKNYPTIDEKLLKERLTKKGQAPPEDGKQ